MGVGMNPADATGAGATGAGAGAAGAGATGAGATAVGVASGADGVEGSCARASDESESVAVITGASTAARARTKERSVELTVVELDCVMVRT